MKTITLTLAATAIAMTGFAYAGEAKDETAVAKAPTVMTDAQMEKLVAGTLVVVRRGNGTFKCMTTSGNGYNGGSDNDLYTIIDTCPE